MYKLILFIFLLINPACDDAGFKTGGGGGIKAPETGDFTPQTGENKVSQDPFGTGDDVKTKEDPNNLFGGAGESKIISFAMLVNDLKCGFCHTTVRGNIVSVTTVPQVWEQSHAIIEGDWYVSGLMNAGSGTQSRYIETRGALIENYTGPKLPRDEDGDGQPDFPTFDPEKIKPNMKGILISKDTTIRGVEKSNVVLIGTDDRPIEIKGEILIEGDLIIKGKYKGIGNIYTTGRIYIPGDIVATKSAFPFDDDPSTARTQAESRMSATYDALGLASKIAIIVSDFETAPNVKLSVFEHEQTPPEFNAAAIGVRNVYSWYPGGKAEFEKLFETGPQPCPHPDKPRLPHTISRIDAFLYAENAIGGRASWNSYAINGGIMTNHFHIISGARNCTAATHPIHGYPRNRNHINFDWRYVHGLQILKQLGYYFDNSND